MTEEVISGGTEEEVITIPKKEYEALVLERDQLRVNIYLIASNLKEIGFDVSDKGNIVQKLGTELIQKLRLSQRQLAMVQEQIQV